MYISECNRLINTQKYRVSWFDTRQMVCKVTFSVSKFIFDINYILDIECLEK